ncbi:hypothetical protein SSX86_023444 [Deinandra increscens subsp. villosa]|uniref:MOM1 alpha-helical domain-containing protein n=1 Tax=Deinandra increscens subsp. villosa TaxID=3103831 RepID=A0AAP0GS52_9ASTR
MEAVDDGGELTPRDRREDVSGKFRLRHANLSLPFVTITGDNKDREVENKSPQAHTSRNEDVDKELKTQNSVTVQGAPEKDCEMGLEGRVTDLDQHGDCPKTKALDGKSSESGDVEKKAGGNVSPSNGNIANSDNHMVPTSSYRIEPDLENQQEPDTCHKVTGTSKAAGYVENGENNDVSSNMQHSKYVEFWVPVQISHVQLEQYCATLLFNAMALRSSSKNDSLGALKEVIVTNRKCCNHPYIVDPGLQHSLPKDKERSTLLDVGIKASGKLQFLDHVLPEIQKQQLKVLIIFQPTSGILNSNYPALGQILSDYVRQRYGENSFVHVDGVPSIATKKQAAINKFNTDTSIFIFLLESRSSHPSIKLSSVDVVIIYDSELNLSNDLKSLQKISIDSQSEQIMIFRLYSLSTLEEKVLKLAENNVVIDIRSQSLRSNCDALLTWGASELFDQLTKFHSQTVLDISSEESILKDVVEEFSYIISHKCKRKNTKSKVNIIQVQNCGIYGKNPSHSEIKTRAPEGDQPYIFWRNLLVGRSPAWKFVSESTPRQRKRPSYFLNPSPEGKDGVDGGGVKTRRRTVNNTSTIKPAQLKTVTEGETRGANEGDSAAHNESQSSSANQFWSTTGNNEMNLLDRFKPTVSELCNILNFSEDVKIIVETFLEFVLDNFHVGTEHTSPLLQAFMIALCWTGSSLGKSEINRSESFTLAKKHFNFCCTEHEVEGVYTKLQWVKEQFLKSTQSLDCLKDSISASEGAKQEVERSQDIPNVDALQNHEPHEIVSIKGKEAFEKIKREWDEKRASLEDEYKDDKIVISAVYKSHPSMKFVKLKEAEREFANKLEEHKRLWEIQLEELKATMLETEGQVSAENEFSLHGSQHENPEMVPILPINQIEAQSHDEPACEGGNDIESTGSHTSVKEVADASVKEVVDATVSGEHIGEVPAQQLDDDMEVEVQHVDSGYMEMPAGNHNKENDEDQRVIVDDVAPEVECAEMGTSAGIHAVEDPVEAHNETDVNDMAPHVETAAGSYSKETNEDVTLGLNTTHVVEDRHETVDVASEVECAETGTPTGICDQENAEDGEITPDVGDGCNETNPNDVLPHVQSADMGTPAGTGNNENAEDGEIIPDTSNAGEGHYETSPKDVLPRVESAEMDCNNEDTEDGEIIPDTSNAGDRHNETSPKDVLPRVDSAETGTPAGTCNKENAEDGEIIPDTSNAGDSHNETSPKDVLSRAESAEMGTPAGTCNNENAEDGEIIPDTSNACDDRNETSPKRIESDEMATSAGTCDKENAEDGEIIPDTPNVDHHETSPKDVPVESAEMAMSAGNEEIVEDSIIRPDALHANEDHNGPCGYNGSSPLSASDHLEPTIPEIQNEPLQPEQLSDPKVHDEEMDNGNLQPSGASQLDLIIPDVENLSDPMVAENPSDTLPPSALLLEPTCQEPNLTSQLDLIIPDENPSDPMVAENPSDTLPASGPLLEPICQDPNLTLPQSGDNLEENLVAAAETPHEEHQPTSSTSVGPTPLLNALNMFDNLTIRVNSQMPNQTDPLQVEVERLKTVRDNVAKFQQETKQRLISDCEKEIAEVVAQIKLKYEARHVEADAAYNSKKTELENNINKVIMNRILADAFRSKCQDLTPSGHAGIQQVSQTAGLMQQLSRLSVSPSMRHNHGGPSSSPGQSSGNQQPPPSSSPGQSSRNQQPPQPPPSEPQLPVQQPQTRPRQPLQVVHQPAALFSSGPPPMANQTTSSTPPSRPLPTRPPSMANQTNSSSPSTTSTPLPTRPPPIITPITPSTTPTSIRPRSVTPSSAPIASRPPPGYNTTNPSTLPNKSPPSIARIDMSAANLRINTETRGQSPYMRPQISNEPRGPPPHMRPMASNDLRAPAPHLRSLTPRNRPLTSTSPVSSTDLGTHQRILPSLHVPSRLSQSPVTPPPPPTSSSPQSLTPLPSKPGPPPAEPSTVPPSEQPPLLSSSDNLNGNADIAPRWVNAVTPQPDVRSQTDGRNVTDLVQESAVQSSSAPDVVCLSDDD